MTLRMYDKTKVQVVCWGLRAFSSTMFPHPTLLGLQCSALLGLQCSALALVQAGSKSAATHEQAEVLRSGMF